MNFRLTPLIAVLGAVAATSALAAEAGPGLLAPGQFAFAGKGYYRGTLDQRDLFAIEHPLAEAKAGDFGFYRAEVSLPSGAQPPYVLYFYATDNNVPSSSFHGLMISQRKGHRFKQVRIDGVPVWSVDTFEAENPGWNRVDITGKVPQSGKFVLEFGLYEEVDASKVLPGDSIQFNPKKAFRPKQELHQTQSYWGDFTILSGASANTPPPPPRWRPAFTIAEKPREQGESWSADAIAIENRELIKPGWSWPVTTGIPFPKGRFDADAPPRVRFEGRYYPVRPLASWPDGSLKWGIVQANVSGGEKGVFKIEAQPAKAAPLPADGAVAVAKGKGEATVSNRLLRFKAAPGKEQAGIEIWADGRKLASGLRFYFEGEKEPFAARWAEPVVQEELPERATIKLEAELTSPGGERFGRCRLLATVFAGQPYIRLLSTVYNENAAESFNATAYGWRLELPKGAKVATGDDGFTASSDSGGLTGVIRYFRFLFPNGVKAGTDGVDLQLFRPGDKAVPFYRTHPGEAKTHEIWLATTPAGAAPLDLEPFSLLVARPPGLAVAPLIRTSGVWGKMLKIDSSAEAVLYDDLIENKIEAYFANVRTGLRPFGNYQGFASSFYWNSLHSMYALYAMTGERKWLDRAERSVRHLMDLLICHWSPDGTNVGGLYAYYSTKTPDGERAFEPDFSNADFNVRSQNPHPAFDHWQLTGDPDGRSVGIGMAEFLISNPAMDSLAKATSARHQGWALVAISRAFMETGDPRYKAWARQLVETAWRHLDPRRGAYIQTHSSSTHPGIVPFMTGILATGLRDYHEATGDPEAVELLAAIAISTREEMLDREWGEKNQALSYYYSPNPYHRYQPTPQLYVGMVAGNAYLAALTGEERFATAAREGWKAYLLGAGIEWSQSGELIYDLPEAFYWLNTLPRHGAAVAAKNRADNSQTK